MAGIDIRLNSQNYVLAPREDGSKISTRPTRQFVQASKTQDGQDLMTLLGLKHSYTQTSVMDSADTESTLMQHLILQSTESFGTQQLRLDGLMLHTYPCFQKMLHKVG